MEHRVATLGERHPPHNFEYATAAARLAAVITDATLINGLALQSNDGSYWRLTGVSPAIWSPLNDITSSLTFGKPLKVGYAGDSIAVQYSNQNGLSPLWWVATELYNCEYTNYFVSALGGSSSSHLLSTQLAQLQALTVKPDLLVVQSLQNDYIGTSANADSFAANVTTYVTAALAAGVKCVAVCGHPPKSSVPDVAQAVLRLNKILDNYCRITPGTYYIDTVSVWRAPPTAAETGINWKGTANTSNAMSDDGTHPTGLAGRALAPLFLPLMQRLARPVSVMPAVAQNYDNTNWQFNNVLGLDGLMIGTNGQYNSVNNANVAGSAATAYARWNLTDGNGITATPTIVTGSDGYRYQEITLSGTASADATVRLNRQYIENVASGSFIGEAVIEFENVVNIGRVHISLSNMPVSGFGSGTKALFSIVSGRMLFRTAINTMSNSGFVNKDNSIDILIPSGTTVSGKVRIGRVGVHRVG